MKSTQDIEIFYLCNMILLTPDPSSPQNQYLDTQRSKKYHISQGEKTAFLPYWTLHLHRDIIHTHPEANTQADMSACFSDKKTDFPINIILSLSFNLWPPLTAKVPVLLLNSEQLLCRLWTESGLNQNFLLTYVLNRHRYKSPNLFLSLFIQSSPHIHHIKNTVRLIWYSNTWKQIPRRGVQLLKH